MILEKISAMRKSYLSEKCGIPVIKAACRQRAGKEFQETTKSVILKIMSALEKRKWK